MTIVFQNKSNSHKHTSKKFIMRCQFSIFDIKPCSFPLEVSAFSIARCAPWTRSSVNLSPRNYKSIETYTCIGHTAFFSRYVNCIENFTTHLKRRLHQLLHHHQGVHISLSKNFNSWITSWFFVSLQSKRPKGNSRQTLTLHVYEYVSWHHLWQMLIFLHLGNALFTTMTKI